MARYTLAFDESGTFGDPGKTRDHNVIGGVLAPHAADHLRTRWLQPIIRLRSGDEKLHAFDMRTETRAEARKVMSGLAHEMHADWLFVVAPRNVTDPEGA